VKPRYRGGPLEYRKGNTPEARWSSHGRENSLYHFTVGKNFAAANIVASIESSRIVAHEHAGFCEIVGVNRLAQSRGVSKHRKEAE
jgi:hypothetical protein